MDSAEAEDLYLLELQRRKKLCLYGSFLLCVLSIALQASALGTESWFEADLANVIQADTSSGHFNTGLFSGSSVQDSGLASRTFSYHTVCDAGYCLFSCGATKAAQEQQLAALLNGGEVPDCIADDDTARGGLRTPLSQSDSFVSRIKSSLPRSLHALLVHGGKEDDVRSVVKDEDDDEGRVRSVVKDEDDDEDHVRSVVKDEDDDEDHVRSVVKDEDDEEGRVRSVVKAEDDSQSMPTVDREMMLLRDANDTVPGGNTDGLLSQGLWAATIAFLALGILFSGVGSVFAIVNTATTPVEAITGIPGLYIWNGVAALMELIAIILWSVQFSSRLTKNVLVVDALQGWTTEGNEKLGYSFWLVVVAVVIHIANCGLIFFGTYEPKAKERIQEPDKATNDILLY